MATPSLDQYLANYQLTLVQAEGRGRNVVATGFIKRGSIVTTSQPLGTVPLASSRREYCNYCFRRLGAARGPPLQRCSRCKSAYFCDMGCFKNAWLSYHQFVCRPAENDNDDEEEDDDNAERRDLEMLERVALNVSRYHKRKEKLLERELSQENSNNGTTTVDKDETVEVTMEAFFSLMDHYDEQPKTLRNQFTRMAEQAKRAPYLVETSITVQELVRYLGRFRCNNFGIYDEQMFTIGEGTYPVASLFNHSCRPNAAVIFDGALLTIKAIDDIQLGQEITIAYVDIAHSRTQRKRMLRDKYFFDCTCERCTDGTCIGRIDTLLGEEESDWDRAQSLLDPDGGPSAKMLRVIEDEWDLYNMTKRYNRRNGNLPDPAEPLTLPNYVHLVLPLLTPYLWTASNPELCFVGNSPPPSSCTMQHITEFDDPPASAASPYPGNTYHEILESTIDRVLAYSAPNAHVPYRITTLSTATRLFYDQMMEGRWRNATKLGMYILAQYSIIYPPYHPMLAHHLLLLAKSAWNSSVQNELVYGGRRLEKAQERGIRRWILLTKDCILHTFGKQSNMWRELVELEWIFIRDQKLK